MGKVIDYKCLACDAVLKFDSHSNKFKCDYCRNEYKKEDLKKQIINLEKDITEKKDNNNQLDNYKCSNCGAVVVALENTKAKFCPYCKTKKMIKTKLMDNFNSEYIIPFKTTREEIFSLFKQFYKKKIFVPRAFKLGSNIENIVGVYIPSLIYEADVQSDISATCKLVSRLPVNGNINIKTDTYEAFRSGYIKINSKVIALESRCNNEFMSNIEPFNYEELIKFSNSYLSGFLVDYPDINLDKANKMFVEKIENITEDNLIKDIKGYNSVIVQDKKINILNKKMRYCLLPVWILNVEYKNKIYKFIANGQTGKFISEDKESNVRLIILWFIIFGVFYLMAWLLFLVGVI